MGWPFRDGLAGTEATIGFVSLVELAEARFAEVAVFIQ
jgi:hypothetical protein